MRKLILSIFLAGAAVSPALAAQDRDHGRREFSDSADVDRAEARAQRNEARNEAREQARSERSGGEQRAQQFRADPTPQVEARPREQQASGGFDRSRSEARQREQAQGAGQFDRSRFERSRQQQVADQQQVVERQQSGERSDRAWRGGPTQQGEQRRQTWTGDRNGGFAQQGEQTRQTWTGDRNGGWARHGGDFRQRRVDQQQQANQQNRWVNGSRWANGGWNRDWRNDRRYDWRNYRDRHRSTFRLGIYFDPFGYGYRPFDIGYRLTPAYYGQRYRFDPAMYGLPYPPPGTQWVRYWNDALLVDVYSGEVIDVIQNFFW